MAETVFLAALVGIVLALIISTIRRRRRMKKRQESLHRGADGAYYWIDFDGRHRKYHTHPADQGGPWFAGGPIGSDGGGGFSDGGDGGGGGD